MKTLLNLRLSKVAICTWCLLGFILSYLTYLGCIAYVVYDFLRHHQALTATGLGAGYIAIKLHPKTGGRVIRFVHNKVLVKR